MYTKTTRTYTYSEAGDVTSSTEVTETWDTDAKPEPLRREDDGPRLGWGWVPPTGPSATVGVTLRPCPMCGTTTGTTRADRIVAEPLISFNDCNAGTITPGFINADRIRTDTAVNGL